MQDRDNIWISVVLMRRCEGLYSAIAMEITHAPGFGISFTEVIQWPHGRVENSGSALDDFFVRIGDQHPILI